MFPAAPIFSSGGQPLPAFSLQGPGPSFSTQPPFLPQSLQDPLIQGADPNSPDVFRQNIRHLQEQVLQLQNFARRVLAGIQNAYQPGNGPSHTEADIATLKQLLAMTIESMRQSGVGALPVLPASPAPTVPTEQQLVVNTTRSLKQLYEHVQRSHESASVAASLLSMENVGRSTTKLS